MGKDGVIRLEFGVLGGGEISGTSGRNIKKDIQLIVNQLNTSPVTKISFGANTVSIDKTIQRLKSEFRNLQELAKLNIKTTAKTANGVSGKGSVGQQVKETARTTRTAEKAALLEEKRILNEIVNLTIKKEALINKIRKTQSLLSDEERKVYTNEYFDGKEGNPGYIKNATNTYESRIEKLRESLSENGKAAADAEIKKIKERNALQIESLSIQKQLFNAQKLSNKDIKKDKLTAQAQSLLERYDSVAKIDKKAREISDKLAADIEEYSKRIAEPKLTEDYTDEKGKPIPKPLNVVNEKTLQDIDEFKKKITEAEIGLSQASKASKTLGNKFKEIFSTKILQNIAYFVLLIGVKYVRDVYKNVVELDKAVTNLQIATGFTREETSELVNEYASLAKQLGATVTQIAEGADTWLRQGYSISEASQLIANSTMLAKLGQLEAAEASKALTSAMKGYKVAVEDSLNIVDKFTAVDMKAAVSSGDIATAMAETAASADVAGVSMDKLIGYIATVAEVTQDGAESVGTFYKTLFARMGNVKAGKFSDDITGESLNDVEKVLNSLGVKLRDSEDNFRNFDDVLDDVAANWNRYSNVQQHALATAFSGTRQQEKFIVLMENYADAMNYASVAANSAGTAQQKYNDAYLDSIEARANSLKAAGQQLATNLLDSNLIKSLMNALEVFASILNFVVSKIDIFQAAISIGVGLAFSKFTAKIIGDLNKQKISIKSWADAFTYGKNKFIKALGKIKAGLVEFAASGKLANLLSASLVILINSLSQLEGVAGETATTIISAITGITAVILLVLKFTHQLTAIPIFAIITAIAGAVYGLIKGISGLVTGAANAYKENSEKLSKAAQQAKEVAETETKALEELKDYTEEYKSLTANIGDNEEYSSEQRKEILDLQKKISDAVGREAAGLSLVNMNRAEALKMLKDISAEQAKIARQAARAAAQAATEDKTNYWQEYYEGGVDWALRGDSKEIAIKKTKTNEDDALKKLLAQIDGIKVSETGGEIEINVIEDGAEAQLKAFQEIAQAMIEQGMTGGGFSGFYQAIVSMSQAASEKISAQTQAVLNELDAVTEIMANQDQRSINNLDEYEAYRKALIESAKNDSVIALYMRDGLITLGNIESSVDNYLSENFRDWYNKHVDSLNAAIIQFKDFGDILKEVQGEYDALMNAMDDMESYGVLTADTVSTLLNEYPDLVDYLTLTASGYTLTTESVEKYVEALRAEYQAQIENAEGEEQLTIAKENAQRLEAVLATLSRTKNLEKETDKLNDQLNKYKEIADIRKDLLQSYKEEVDYQKELAKKQKAVADLRTELALARLDTSAAGQAKVRELESELAAAEEELEDYTLEHAVNELCKRIDSEYDGYKDFIGKKLEEIKTAIDNTQISNEMPKTDGNENGSAGNGSGNNSSSNNIDSSTNRNENNVKIPVMGPNKVTLNPENGLKMGEYGVYEGYAAPSWMTLSGIDYTKNKAIELRDEYLAKFNANPRGHWQLKSKIEDLEQYIAWIQTRTMFHSGGFVGGKPILKSNETFAKLLEGELVVTPGQMDDFMQRTFPSMTASSIGNNKSIVYKAPLISINCESVTSESMPKLESLMNLAVTKIRKEFDSAFSRTGLKKL